MLIARNTARYASGTRPIAIAAATSGHQWSPVVTDGTDTEPYPEPDTDREGRYALK